VGEISQLLPVIVGLCGAGILAGTLAGLLGVGGGIINVPVLFFLFQYFGVDISNAMVMATGTSLATIIPTSLSSINSHHKRANIDWSLVKSWALFIVIGVILGSWLVTVTDGRYFTFVFAAIALFVAINLLFRSNSPALFKALPTMPFQYLMATVTGFFSVMAGVGGGTIGVSTLTAFDYAMHRAVGTSAAFGLLISLPGALILLFFAQTPVDAPIGTWGYINFLSLIVLVPLSVTFAPVGVWLGANLDAKKLKKIFAVVLLVTSGRMLMQVI
jgi:uncharacterized membrane protein YfcA